MSRFDDMQRDFKEAVNQTRASFGLSPTDNALDGIREVMLNYAPASINSYSQNDYMQDVSQPDGYQRTPGLGISDPSGSIAAGIEKWYAGDRPTYAESVAQLIRMKPNLTDQQFIDITAQLNTMRTDPTSGFYQNWYETTTSPYVDAIARLGVDVSGGINDEWIEKNQYLLNGARYTDAGTTPAAPTKTSTAAQNAAYYFYQIQRNWADTKEVLQEEAALKKEIDYWVGRDDLNLSDEQILEQLDWKGKYKYLQGLKDAQSTGKRYNYTQPIDYNPDNLRGYIWAARNGGGSGDAETDAVSAALGMGNVWQENKAISNKLDFKSEDYSPFSVKCTLDDEAQYFGVKEFPPGWAEEAAKTIIDWNNPDDVKHWQKVEKAEAFTAQAEAEVKEIYNRVDTMIAAGITDPDVIMDGLWDKGLDGSAALTALKKLDASMVKPPEYLEDTTRPIDYRKQDVVDYINQQCEKATEKESLPEFGAQMNQVMNGDSSPSPLQPSFSPTPAPTQGPAATVGGSQPAGLQRSTADVLATPAPTSAASADFPVLGNIDIYNRTPVVNPDGSVSTVDSFSVNIDGKEVLLPTIIAGKRVSQDEAINHYYETGEYLGKFDTVAEADDYAQRLHEQQERLYGDAANRILNTPAPRETPMPVPEPTPTPAPMFGQSDAAQASVPAQMPTPAPRETPRPVPVVDQTAKAVNDAQSKIILDHAKTILATGTPDEKMLLNLAPTANAEGVAADMAGSVQNGTADAAALYDQALKQSRDYVAGHYYAAKQIIKQHKDMQSQLADLQEQRQALIQQRDQMQEQMDFGIVPNIDQTEVEINGETHVFTADYDTVNKRYIIHDSNPTDDPEVEAEKAQYDIDLRSNMNMENYYAERSYDQQVRIDNLNAQLRVLDGDIERAETAINGHQELYDQAQEDIKTSKSSIDAVAALEVQRFNPGVDLTSDAGKEELEEAKTRVGRLASEIDLAMDIGSEYKATEWSSTTVFDDMLTKGKTIEETAKAADEIIAEADQRLDALKQSKADLQSAGVNLPGDYISNIDREIANLEKQKQEAEDFKLRTRDDFAQVVADAKKEALNSGKPSLALYAADPSLDQAEITLADNLSMLAQAGNVNSYDAIQPHKQTYMEYLTQEERDTIIYKWATEPDGEKAAWDYYNSLADAVDVRRTNAQNEELAAFAKDMPVLAAVTSIGISPATAKGAGYAAASLIAGQEINPYSRFFNTTWATKTLDQNAKEKILEPLEEGSPLKKFAGIVYDAVTSGAKSLINSALTGPFGSTVLGPAYMGLQAAGSAVQDVKLRGGSDLQAALVGGATFGGETISELVTTQNIAKAIDSGAEGVKRVMKNVLSNDMVEEFIGESATEFVEGLADDVIMGELSQREQKIKEYEQTMSHEEAVKQADKDFWTDILAAGMTGALSAAGTSGIGYVGGKLTSIGTNTNTTQPSVEGQARATALANNLPLERVTQTPRQIEYAQEPTLRNNLASIETAKENGYRINHDSLFETLRGNVESMLGQAGIDAGSDQGQNIIQHFHDKWVESLTSDEWEGDINGLLNILKEDIDAAVSQEAPAETQHAPQAQTQIQTPQAPQQADYAQEPTLRNNLTNIQTAASNGVVFTRDAVFATLQQNVESMLDQAGIDKNSKTGQNIISRFHDQWMASLDQGGDVGSLVDALKSDLDAAKSTKASVKHGAESMGITPADAKDDQVTARTLTLLTSSLNASKGSQVQALSAALFPVSGDAQGQRAAVSAGLHLANQMGTEQAVAVVQDVILAAEQEGADQQAVKDALRIAALGQGESTAVLNRINQNGVEFGDVQALIEAAGRDAQNPAIAGRMNAIIHNDRVASRTRDLIGQGALNGVKPYEQAYSQAKAQEAQSQQALETEQERAQAMGEHLQTVQAQHAADPANQAVAGSMKQAIRDMAGQVKVVGEYQQSLENHQQKTQEAEKNLQQVRDEAMTKVREQAMADVQAEEQAEAQAEAEAQEAAEAAVLAEVEAQAKESPANYDDLVAQRDQFVQQRDDYQAQLDNNELPMQWQKFSTQNKIAKLNKTIQELDAQIAEAQPATPANNPNVGTLYTNDQVPVSYHWALVPASDLVTSNTDTGEANSAYPAELQPRDRTRAASQDQVAGMVRNLNPARLGESADAQNGAPIVGPDNVVESGNARTMAIRQAMASNPESAARYTQYVRDNAARFGLNPDDVTDNSVLVRVRDTDLDRVAFARAANESTTATYSPSENVQGDADRLTQRMMELFAPSDTGRLDTTENHAFALAFLNEIIPESERGAYMQDDGSISQQGYDRIRNAVFQRAYGSTALTQALTEDTDGSARNVMNALLKAAPRMMALQDAVDQGGVYDTGLAQTIAAAAERYMQLKNAGMSVEAYLEQTAMPGIQTEDEATQSMMRLFEEYRRSGKKLSEALTNIADAVEDAGDPRAVSFLGQNEAPPLTELIRQGVERMLRPKDSLVSAYRGTDQDAMRVGNNGNATTGNIVSPQETIRNVTDALGITNDTRIKKYLRAQRKTSRGYTLNNGIIHLKSAQAAGVAMHEIGHNLDVRLGLQAMNGNMPQLVLDYCANIDPNLPLKYSGKKLNEEVMADFTRIWALDRNAAVNLAGEEFVQKYENALKDNGWLKAMQTAGEQMRNWNAASSMEQAESHVQLEPPKPRKEKLSLTKTRTDLADHTLPMEAVIRAITNSSKTPSMAKNARELILARPSIVKDFTDTTLYDAMVDPQGNDVLRDDGTKYGGLSDIMKQIDRKDEKAFNTYRLALLDVNRKAQNKGVFDDSIDSAKLVKEYETKYPHFKKVSDQLTKWYNKFFQVWLVDTGIKTQQEFDTMRKLYPDYVPLHAAEDSINKPSGKPRTDGNPANMLERAFASDVDKYNPIMGLVENVQKYIMTAKTVEAYRAFDQMMKQAMDDHLDVSAFAEPAQPDMEKIDQRRAKRNIAEVAKNAMEGMQMTGDVSQTGSQAVLDAIAGVADFDYVVHDTATGYDVVNIPMADGSVHSWTIYNPSLLKALTMTSSQGETNKVLRALATLKNIFSANVTARSLKFSGQNVFSDMEEAATTGRTGYNNIMKDILAGSRPVHTAKEIAAGLSLLKNKFAETAMGEKLGMKTSDVYKMFKRFGMLGSRYAFRDTKTQKETRNALYGGHKSLGEAIVDGLKAIGTLKPLETVTGFGEEMTRYNAFAFSGFDLSTYEGRLQAAKAQREASTDFSKFGAASDNTAFRIFGSTVPFLNAQIQGIDKMVDIMSEIKNDPKRRAVLAGRIAVNSLLSGAVVAALRNIAWGDDEKEGYEDLTDYEKTKFIHLFRWPDGSWFKMKRSQNMLVQAADLLGESIGEVSTGYEGDAFADLANGAVEIVKNGMVSTDTSLQPLLDAFDGKNWWGGDIDTYNERQMSMTARYGADTSKAARVISTLTFGAISPNGVEYALKQFMGSAGTLGTAILDTAVNSFNDKRFNGQALLNFMNDEVIGGYIVDPVYSNKVATTFYDGKERLEQIKKEYEAGKAPEAFRANLTQEESNAAAKELKAMLSKGGAVYDANKQYSDLKNEYNAVMSDDTTLTPVQQADKARELRHQMNVALLTANAAMGDFFNKYGYNSIFDQAVMNTMNILSGDQNKAIPDSAGGQSDYDSMPQTFKDDENEPYMQKSKAVYEATGERSALPHPQMNFTSKGVEYEIAPEDQDTYNSLYKTTYQKYIAANSAKWDAMTDEQRLDILNNAHNKARDTAKGWYKKKHNIK